MLTSAAAQQLTCSRSRSQAHGVPHLHFLRPTILQSRLEFVSVRFAFSLSTFKKAHHFPVGGQSRGSGLFSRCLKRRSNTTFTGSNDGSPANSDPFAKSDEDWEETRTKLNAFLQVTDAEANSVLHEAARKFQLAMEQQGFLSKYGWLAKSWLGVDQLSWIKPLAYQAAVHALLEAVLEIASRGEGRDRDVHIFVQRSMSRQLTPLKESINEQFSARSPSAEKWFWSEQHPIAVASFVDILERDSRFTAVTSTGWEGASVCPSKATDVSLITLAIGNTAAILKLGAAKLSCPPFFSTLTEEIGRLMSMLVEFLPIDQVYNFTSGVGLRDEFLDYFGQQAASYRDEGEMGGEEVVFWVDLVQQLLRGAIIRERIRTKLTSYDSIEVLERDLAVFGFFAYLGRRTWNFLSARKIVDSDEQLASMLRYLIGGSILFYPQLASLNTYQLFIEVACEEMEWMPLYPASPSRLDHGGHVLNDKVNENFKLMNSEAIIDALDNCSRWISDFMKYSTWVQQPAGSRAGTFLLNSQTRLNECLRAHRIVNQMTSNKCSKDAEDVECSIASSKLAYQQGGTDAGQGNKGIDEVQNVRKLRWFGLDGERKGPGSSENGGVQKMQQLNLFDKELQRVDEALSRLECLLLEPEMGLGKEHLTAACTNLEKIRQLKKDVESLEASLQEKAASMIPAQDNVLIQQQRSQKSSQERSYHDVQEEPDGQWSRPRKNIGGNWAEGITRFLSFLATKHSGSAKGGVINTSEDEAFDQAAAVALQEASTVSKEIQRFEILRQELMDLESRIQKSALEHSKEAEILGQINGGDTGCLSSSRSKESSNVVTTKRDIFSESLVKIKDMSSDVWRGTQLLTTDIAAATVLLKRSASGEELTEREKKVIKRTMLDLASVIPIGLLMLLPVTAVGHAAILAAIQRYVPSLIPSAYARERLELMQQLEQVREMETADVNEENALFSPLAIDRSAKTSD